MRLVYLCLGFLSLGLGIAGTVLPVLPTTPFAILAAFLFSKSSPKMEQYILDLPALGPLVKEWRDHRVIKTSAKLISVLMIILVMGGSIYSVKPKFFVQIIMISIGISVILFILTRKSYK